MSSQEIQHLIKATQADLDASEAKIQPARVQLARAIASSSPEAAAKAKEVLVSLRSAIQAAADSVCGLQELAVEVECAELEVALAALLEERKPIAAESDTFAEQIEALEVPPFTPFRNMEKTKLKQLAHDVRTQLYDIDRRVETIKGRLEYLRLGGT